MSLKTNRAGWPNLLSIIIEDSSAFRASEVGRRVIGNTIQVRQRATAQLVREGILGQVRVKLDTSWHAAKSHSSEWKCQGRPSGQQLQATLDLRVTPAVNSGQGPDNGFRTLMVISSNLACFHSSPPLPLL